MSAQNQFAQLHSIAPSPADGISDTVDRVRTVFQSGRTRSIAWRKAQLTGLVAFCRDREAAISDALRSDLGKPPLEAYGAEISYISSEAAYLRKHVERWARPERVRTGLMGLPGRSEIHRQPYGVSLIIGPWNYPVQLLLVPLAGAIAAGNASVVKPSEVTPATSALLAEWLPRYVDPEAVAVVEGGVPETTELLAQAFDYVFYTGNGSVGRIVMEAAAKHLTPVTLELGGKSPCLVDAQADLETTARRILWGKFYNAGQTCVAPDYVLVERSREEALLETMKRTLVEFYGTDPQRSPDYGRIVNERHWDRVMGLIEGGGEVVAGGRGDRDERYIAPTILRDVPDDAPVMADEIFGPVLPVIGVPSMDAAIEAVNRRPKPLALYLYSPNEITQTKVLERTSSGGACINHAWLHLAVRELPFGGVGASGMGAYHGRASFETFSHRRSVLRKPFAPDPSLLYPPYDATKRKWLRRLL